MPKQKSLKPVPKFDSEDEEREFWATHDSADHVDWSRAKPTTFSRLKPTTQTISLRLPESLKVRLEAAAAREGVSVNTWLVQALQRYAHAEPRPSSGGSRRRLTGYGRS